MIDLVIELALCAYMSSHVLEKDHEEYELDDTDQ